MWWLLAVTGAFAGVGPGVTVRVAAPPPTVLAGVRTLEVAPFGGLAGEQIAMEIRGALADPDRVGKDAGAFGREMLGEATELGAELVSAAVGGGIAGKAAGGVTRLTGAMVAEAVEQEPLVIDDGMRIDVFQLVEGGADARLAGSVQIASTVRDYKMSQAKLDANGNVVKDANGNTVTVEVSCKERKATAQVTWTVTGKASAQGALTRDAADSKCGSEIGTLASEETLAQPLLTGWGPSIAEQIAPSWHIVRLDLMRDKDLREELKLARADTLMPAICNLRGLVAFDEYYVPGIYNTGVMLEALGHLPEARDAYNRALAIKQERAIGKALTRVAAREKATAAMSSAYGLTYTVGAADYSMCPALPDGRRVVLKKDTDLFADETGTTAISTLPKGMKVWVTAEGSTRATITTMDGKIGLIDAKAAK